MWSGTGPGLGDFVGMSGDGTVVVSGDSDFTDTFSGRTTPGRGTR
jgi:hypothetical protein